MRIVFAWILIGAGVLCGQEKLAFEVASIKPNKSGDRHSGSHYRQGSAYIDNNTLKDLIQLAYDVKDYAFSGPDWLDSERFDIVAKPPAAASPEQYRIMLQTLLADRFKLTVHREQKEMSGYALVVAKGGLKIKELEPSGGSDSNSSRGTLSAKTISMSKFAEWVSRQVGRPTIDATGTKGVFTFKLEWSPVENQPPEPGAPPPAAPTIYTALQEQLGLRLQGQKVPVNVLVVDHMERVPTEN